jgi:hypothetical protein
MEREMTKSRKKFDAAFKAKIALRGQILLRRLSRRRLSRAPQAASATHQRLKSTSRCSKNALDLRLSFAPTNFLLQLS